MNIGQSKDGFPTSQFSSWVFSTTVVRATDIASNFIMKSIQHVMQSRHADWFFDNMQRWHRLFSKAEVTMTISFWRYTLTLVKNLNASGNRKTLTQTTFKPCEQLQKRCLTCIKVSSLHDPDNNLCCPRYTAVSSASTLKLPRAKQMKVSRTKSQSTSHGRCKENVYHQVGVNWKGLVHKATSERYHCRLLIMNTEMNFKITDDTPYQKHKVPYFSATSNLMPLQIHGRCKKNISGVKYAVDRLRQKRSYMNWPCGKCFQKSANKKVLFLAKIVIGRINLLYVLNFIKNDRPTALKIKPFARRGKTVPNATV